MYLLQDMTTGLKQNNKEDPLGFYHKDIYGKLSIMDTGIDITLIERIKRLTGEDAFSGRVFTQMELSRAKAMKSPAPYLAGLFCAKEAFMKALGTGWTNGVSWQDIEVRQTKGRPTISLSGRAAELTGSRRTHLSIACSKKLAIATVVLE